MIIWKKKGYKNKRVIFIVKNVKLRIAEFRLLFLINLLAIK